MVDFLWIFVIVSAVAALVYFAFQLVPIHWYLGWLLAKYDFVFTTVPEGYFKIVVRFGAMRKVLMSKQGHKIDCDGHIVELAPGEPPESAFPGGLRLIGWPFIDRIYTRKMKFSKSLPDGSVKSYDEESIDTFYAKVDYPYALPFAKCEDKNNLPLNGHATLLAHVANPAKSLYLTANFYDTMVGLVLPSVRECLKGYSYDELKDKDDLDEIVWEALDTEVNPDAPNGVIRQLLDNYGVGIVALRIVNIDPPEEYRDITLTKWKAEREADAAGAVARKEAMLTGGTLTLMVDEQIAAMEKHYTLSPGEKKQIRAESLNMLLRERAGKVGGLKDIRVANADGTSFAGGSISEIVGGIVATVAAATSAKENPPRANPGNPGGGGAGRGKKKFEDMSPEEKDRAIFDDD